MNEINELIRRYYELVNDSTNCGMTPGECYDESLKIKEKMRIIKENYKEDEDFYRILTSFCDEEYNPLGYKRGKK